MTGEPPEPEAWRVNKKIRQYALRKWPVLYSFQDFSLMENNPHMDYQQFDWKYYQFYHGNRDWTIEKSSENSSPVTFSDLSTDIIVNIVKELPLEDCVHLRAVSSNLRNIVDSNMILIFALKKEPVFDAYEAYCMMESNPPIDYLDFDWKYYQFYHGTRDLSVMRSSENSSPLTFTDLPIDFIEKVIKELWVDDCASLRTVFPELRNLADFNSVRLLALGNKPVYNAYKNLSWLKNDQLVDYLDFEWKYFQFYHGNQDLSVMRSSENSSPVTFSDLPLHVIVKIIKEAALDDCLALRNVSRGFRNLVDSTEIRCKRIEFSFYRCGAKIEFDNKCSYYYPKDLNGSYKQTEGTATKHSRPNDNRNHKQLMAADVLMYLKNPKLTIGQLALTANHTQMYDEFLKLLQSLESPLKVRTVSIDSREDAIPMLLQILEPGTLEDIRITNRHKRENFDQIVDSEQWRRATRLRWASVQDLDMQKMLHFKEIQICIFIVSDQNLIMLRDVLLKSAHLERCILRVFDFDRSPSDKDQHVIHTVRIMRQDPAFDVETCRFAIPNSRNYLQLSFERNDSLEVRALHILKVLHN